MKPREPDLKTTEELKQKTLKYIKKKIKNSDDTLDFTVPAIAYSINAYEDDLANALDSLEKDTLVFTKNFEYKTYLPNIWCC